MTSSVRLLAISGVSLLAVTLAQRAASPTHAAAAVQAPRGAPDSLLLAAQRFLAAGQPWQASRLLTPVLADSTERTPARVLTAARASAQWGGAAETVRLLRSARWLDDEEDGEGHALLAAAWLAQDRDTLARDAAAAAVRTAGTARARAERQVLLARALDRLDQRDSAAAVYSAAAAGLPSIGDWLRLRALGVTDDSAARAALAVAVQAPLVRARLPWMEAQAVERSGDTLRAARAYAAAGGSLKAMALRAGAVEARDSVRRAAMQLLRSGIGGADGRAAVALVRRTGAVRADELLLVARTLERSGDAAGAAASYKAAIEAKVALPQDRLAYGDLLVRLGRHAEAVRAYRPLAGHPKLGATATYRRARAHVRAGQGRDAHLLLTQIPAKWSRDTAAASQALYLLGDLATDARDDADAIRHWRRLTTRYPTASLAPATRFRTGIALMAAGEYTEAVGSFDTLLARYPRSSEALAARYWSGRALAALGDTAAAQARWRAVIAADKRSWYAGLSEARLGLEPWRPAPAVDRFEAVPEVDSVLAAAQLLDQLGLGPEARREVDAVVAAASSSQTVERLLAVSNALRRAGYGRGAITVAQRASAKQTEPDARTWRLLYPLDFAEALRHEAGLRGIDPSFAAALIRQESLYLPAATSPAGARGLMQLMPEVGRITARSLRYPQWDVALLWQPDVNLELGMTHLAELLERYGEPVRVLAAYNAGGSRVDRWATKAGVADPELFAERIPYVETRNYVRIIQRAQQFYRALYDFPATAFQP